MRNTTTSGRLSRRTLLKRAAQVSGAMLADRAFGAAAAPPNIVFILADDLGYADLSCYGRRDYATPALDRLASQGMMLTHGYSNSAICSPTRVGLITGRYQYRLRVGLDEPLTGANAKIGLPPSHPTLPSLLKALGYRTSLVGKWHMGGPPEHGPLKSGYEHFFGILSGGTDYFTHQLMIDKQHVGGGLFEGEVPVQRHGYVTDLLGERACAEIEQAVKERKPFFHSVHFTAPHWPWEGPEDEAIARMLNDSRQYGGGDLKTFAAMVQNMDSNIGRILATLEDSGAAENTLVIFTSDNGGERFSDTWPFVGAKGELLEGGIRVPAIVRWPKAIAAGGRCTQPLISMDWLPTLLAAAGSTPSPGFPSDGMNLLPVLRGESSSVSRKLFWRFKAAEQAAVRDGQWKYLKLAAREFLFDVVADPRERANQKDARQDIFERLRADFAAWNATMLPYPAESYSETSKAGMADRY